MPKKLVDADGSLTGERNDVALAGLNHKLGYRGTTNTLLNFGEGKFPVRGGRPGAIGYLVGEPRRGPALHVPHDERGAHRRRPRRDDARLRRLRCMRSTTRRTGRRAGRSARRQGPGAAAGAASSSTPTCKRMLLAQKSYCEGALALELYCARLVDEQHTGDAGGGATRRALLLEVLTPIAKSWPSEWCLEANSLAIQVHGGYGYTRDFPVEQYWRDNRLNMIHEGTHGIQALDLLGPQGGDGGRRGLASCWRARDQRDDRARAGSRRRWPSTPTRWRRRCSSVGAATAGRLGHRRPDEALANATPYLQAFGHMVLAWIWLDVALAAPAARRAADAADALPRQAAAARYFFHYELPKIGAWLRRRRSARPHLPHDARGGWF